LYLEQVQGFFNENLKKEESSDMAHHHPHLSSAQLAKRDAVEEIKKQIEESQSFVIIDYKGLTVAQDTEFRAEFRKNGVVYKVLQNTLFKKGS